MEGYLTKRGSFFTNWKSRWFELTGGKLQYFKNQTKKEQKGEYVLDTDTIVEEDADKEGNSFVFRILNKDRELFLSALDESSRRKWINSIELEIKRLKAVESGTMLSEQLTKKKILSSGSVLTSAGGNTTAEETTGGSSAGGSSAETTTTTVFMEGFLMKRSRGKFFHNWKARWFVLSGTVTSLRQGGAVLQSDYRLRYYKDSRDAAAHKEGVGDALEKGCFVFDHLTKVSSLNELEDYAHIMVLSRGDFGAKVVGGGNDSGIRSSDIGLRGSNGGDDAAGGVGSGDVGVDNTDAGGDGRVIYLSAVDSRTENQWLDKLSVVTRLAHFASQGGGGGAAVGEAAAKALSAEAAARAKRAAQAGKRPARRLRDAIASTQLPPTVAKATTGSAAASATASAAASASASASTPAAASAATYSGAGAAAEESVLADEAVDRANDEDESEDEDEEFSGSPAPGAVAGGGGGAGNNVQYKSTPGLPAGWVEVRSGDGSVYYYHQKARVSRWDKPTEQVAQALEQRLAESEKQAQQALARRREELSRKAADKAEMDRLADGLQAMVVGRVDAWKYSGGSGGKKGKGSLRSLPDLLLNVHTVVPTLIPTCVVAVEGEASAGSGGGLFGGGSKAPATPSAASLTPADVKKAYMKAVRVLHPDKIQATTDLETRMLAEAVFKHLAEIYNVYRAAAVDI